MNKKQTKKEDKKRIIFVFFPKKISTNKKQKQER